MASPIKPITERLIGKRKIENGCWLWTGTVSEFGYGIMEIVVQTGKQMSFQVHRVSFAHYKGPIPEGMCVLHKCDVRACFNPDHLFLGTRQENTADMLSKGREARGEQTWNAKLSNANIRRIRRAKKSGVRSTDIAKYFSTDRRHINRIVKLERWQHVHGDDPIVVVDRRATRRARESSDVCGETETIDHLKVTVVCNLPKGHDGKHECGAWSWYEIEPEDMGNGTSRFTE